MSNMNHRNLQFFAERHFAGRGIGLYIAHKTPDLTRVAKPIEFQPEDESKLYATEWEPTLYLSYEVSAQLMDELWRAGVRPSADLYGSHEAMGVMKAHLEDMRRLVFQSETSNAVR